MAQISEARARGLRECYRIRHTPYLNTLNRYYLTLAEAEKAARIEVDRNGETVLIEQLEFLRRVAEIATVRRDALERVWTDVSACALL